MIREYTTINTFSRVPVPAQIVTYLIFLGQALTFFICMYVNFSSTAKQIAILVLYIVTMFIQVYLTIATSCSDPSDSLMISYRNNPHGRINFNIENCLYCEVCASYVQQSSRHCKVCQRCVQNFDHHCMWVNNCVGSKNYRYFLAMTTITLINLLVYIIGMILLWTEGQWQNYIGSMITLWVFSFVVVLVIIMLINLIGLHIYLIYKGYTTYQFIILQRQEEKLKKQEQQMRNIQNRLQKNRQITVAQIKVSNSTKKNQTSHIQQLPSSVVPQVQPVVSQQSIKQQENSFVIFGQPSQEHQSEHDQKTQKSESISRRPDPNHPSALDTGQNLIQEHGFSSKREMKENLSEFFTKNKSLKFFIGDEIGCQPQSTKNKASKFYQSVRPSSHNIFKQNSFVKGQGKTSKQYFSVKK